MDHGKNERTRFHKAGELDSYFRMRVRSGEWPKPDRYVFKTYILHLCPIRDFSSWKRKLIWPILALMVLEVRVGQLSVRTAVCRSMDNSLKGIWSSLRLWVQWCNGVSLHWSGENTVYTLCPGHRTIFYRVRLFNWSFCKYLLHAYEQLIQTQWFSSKR